MVCGYIYEWWFQGGMWWSMCTNKWSGATVYVWRITFALTFLEKVCHMQTQRTDWVKNQNGCRRRDDDPLWNGQALPILWGKTPGELVRAS